MSYLSLPEDKLVLLHYKYYLNVQFKPVITIITIEYGEGCMLHRPRK